MAAEEDMDRWEQLDAYLNGAMTPPERQQLENRLQQDDQLATELENLRISRLAVNNYGLRGDLKGMHARAMAQRGQQPKVMPIWRYAGRIAAGIVLLLVGMIGFRLATLSPDTLTSLPQNLYTPDITRGATSDFMGAKMREAYRQGDYTQCVGLYENNQLRSMNDRPEDDLMAGNAYLALHQPEPAKRCFQKIIHGSDPDKPFAEEAEYYLALALLQNNEFAAADALFTPIRQNPDHPMHNRVGTWFYWQLQWLRWRAE